jgi:hypothetical protein
MSRRFEKWSQRRVLWPVVLAVLFLPATAAAAPPAWDPARTWVFAVSATEWKFDRTLNMPKKGRQDGELIKTFKDRGVPADHITFLKDKQGTLANIRRSFTNLLNRTGKGDFLVFYFQGHGGRDIDGNTSKYYFINYDANNDDDNTFLYVKEVFDLIEAHFKGSGVLLTADCCCSGGLVSEARKRKTSLSYCCLASVYSHNGSTGAWTYTDALVKGFRGDPMVDLDGDGTVTLDELARYIEFEMAYVEEQMAAYKNFNNFDASLRLATGVEKSHPRLGQFVEAEQDGTWYRAKIIEFKDKKFKVSYLGYDETEWVGPRRIRDLRPKHFKDGAAVAVLDEDGKGRNATVKTARLGLHLVHYDDDRSPNGLLDEWVPQGRIKERAAE